jgi:acetyl esterase/lipase
MMGPNSRWTSTGHRTTTRRSPSTFTVAAGAPGDKADDGGRRLAPLSACGVTVVAVNYRLVPRARFPAPLHDLKAAVRWLRGNGPHLGLPAERIGIWEPPREYLGSLLALTAGIDRFEGTVGGHFGQSSAVQAVVHWFSQSDLAASGSRTEVETRLLPFAFEAGLLDVADIAGPAGRTRELSLLSWVSAGAPPFLIAHGDRDHVVLPSEGLALHHALVRAESRFELLGGAGYEGAEFDQPASPALTAARLRATLCEPTA